jgi:hypothetical protein
MNKTLSLLSGISLPLGIRLGRSLRANNTLSLIGGVGLGVGLMYILDPNRGARRRSFLINQVTHGMNILSDALCVTSRDLSNRARGLVAETKNIFTSEEDVSDEKLEARVRSKIGRVVSHPTAIEVISENGQVRLYGPILAEEVDDLLSAVASVKGVVSVEDQLEIFEQAENIPDLQGGIRRIGDRFELFQVNWSPSARLIVGIMGGTLGVYGANRKDMLGTALSVLGFGLLTRAVTNMETKRLIGLGRTNLETDQDLTRKEDVETGKLSQVKTEKETFQTREATAR